MITENKTFGYKLCSSFKTFFASVSGVSEVATSTKAWPKTLPSSILPNYKGLNTHQRVIEAGDKVHGCSVHYVHDKIDDGKVLGQALVEVATSDTPDTLAKKVLKEEHNLYPKVLFSVIKKNKLFLLRKY